MHLKFSNVKLFLQCKEEEIMKKFTEETNNCKKNLKSYQASVNTLIDYYKIKK